MVIDLTLINYNKEEEINIDEDLYFSKDDLKDTEIIDLKGVHVKGKVYKDSLDSIVLEATVSGAMIIPSSRTLKPTKYEFETDIEENISENEENSKKIQKSIDILPIIWENILMEIPIRVINPDEVDENLKGDGWELITDED